MSPRSLLFSSDQETSQVVSQVLRDLGLEVEACSEIFSAIEKLTTKIFDVVLADLEDGAEAAFLLKTCQELNSTRSALSVAIARAGVSAAQPGVALVLNKPLIPEKIKWSLSHCEQLASRLNSSGKAEVVPIQPLKSVKKPPVQVKKLAKPIPISLPPRVTAPLLKPENEIENLEHEVEFGLVPLAESANPKFRGTAHTASLTANAKSLGFLNEENPLHVRSSQTGKQGSFSRIYRPMIMGIAMLGLAYIGVQPARSAALVSSVAVIYTKAVENTQSWLQTQKAEEAKEEAQLQVVPVERSIRRRAEVIHLEHTAPVVPADASAGQASAPGPIAGNTDSAIPSSLKSSFQAVSDETEPAAVEAKLAPSSVLTGVQPVAVSEETFMNMVVDKVEPDYPQQALSSGLQGPVVFQAWIGKDGKVENLRLVHGYMVLGKAASDAVKHWRFKPYMVNGQAVEAQTYITVNFKPPNS